MGGHFRPFAEVQNGKEREVTRKWLVASFAKASAGLGNWFPLNRDRVIPKALVCGAAVRYPQKRGVIWKVFLSARGRRPAFAEATARLEEESTTLGQAN
jgi:hypothetical protein